MPLGYAGTWTAQGSTATFTPAFPGFPGASQIAWEVQVSDLTGVQLSFYVQFTTAASTDTTPLQLTGAYPPDGSQISDNATLIFRFSKPVFLIGPNAVQFFAEANLISNGISLSMGEDAMTIQVQASLPFNSDITVNFGSDLRDLAGDPLQASTLHYHSATQAESKGPVLASIIPPPGATGVDVNAHIQPVFTHPMDAASVQNGIVVTSAGSAVTGSITGDSAAINFDFAPAGLYPAGQTVEVFGLGTIYDSSGALITPFYSSFATAGAPGDAVHAISYSASTTASIPEQRSTCGSRVRCGNARPLYTSTRAAGSSLPIAR
jgi:hypothetical protein